MMAILENFYKKIIISNCGPNVTVNDMTPIYGMGKSLPDNAFQLRTVSFLGLFASFALISQTYDSLFFRYSLLVQPL